MTHVSRKIRDAEGSHFSPQAFFGVLAASSNIVCGAHWVGVDDRIEEVMRIEILHSSEKGRPIDFRKRVMSIICCSY